MHRHTHTHTHTERYAHTLVHVRARQGACMQGMEHAHADTQICYTGEYAIQEQLTGLHDNLQTDEGHWVRDLAKGHDTRTVAAFTTHVAAFTTHVAAKGHTYSGRFQLCSVMGLLRILSRGLGLYGPCSCSCNVIHIPFLVYVHASMCLGTCFLFRP